MRALERYNGGRARYSSGLNGDELAEKSELSFQCSLYFSYETFFCCAVIFCRQTYM